MRSAFRYALASVACGFLVAASIGARAQESHVNGQSSQSKDGRSEREGSPGRPAEIERLARMLVGNWNVVATIGPNATRAKGLSDTGTNRIVLGPGGRSVVENYHTDGDSGSRSALGILWWDEKARGYRTMFCDNADRDGCSVYDGLGKWEGNDLVFRFKRDRGESKIDGKEVFTSTSPTSFTVQFFESRNGGPEDATWTVRNTRAE